MFQTTNPSFIASLISLLSMTATVGRHGRFLKCMALSGDPKGHGMFDWGFPDSDQKTRMNQQEMPSIVVLYPWFK